MMAAGASASPVAAAACASDRVIIPFAAKAKLGGSAANIMHNTKRMTASPLLAVIRCETNVGVTPRKRTRCEGYFCSFQVTTEHLPALAEADGHAWYT